MVALCRQAGLHEPAARSLQDLAFPDLQRVLCAEHVLLQPGVQLPVGRPFEPLAGMIAWQPLAIALCSSVDLRDMFVKAADAWHIPLKDWDDERAAGSSSFADNMLLQLGRCLVEPTSEAIMAVLDAQLASKGGAIGAQDVVVLCSLLLPLVPVQEWSSGLTIAAALMCSFARACVLGVQVWAATCPSWLPGSSEI